MKEFKELSKKETQNSIDYIHELLREIDTGDKQ